MLGSLFEKLRELTKLSTGNRWYFTSQDRGEKDDQNQDEVRWEKREEIKAFIEKNNVKMLLYVILR